MNLIFLFFTLDGVKIMWWIGIVIVVIIAWIVIRFWINRDDSEKRKKGLNIKLSRQKDFKATQRIELDNYRYCLAIDEKRNKFSLIYNNTHFGYKPKDYVIRTFSYKDLLKVEFIENGRSCEVNEATNPYKKIAMDSIILSENGLSLTDLYDTEQGYDSIKQLGVQLIVNNVSDPVIFINTLTDENGCEKDSPEYKEAVDKAKEFYKSLKLIIGITDELIKKRIANNDYDGANQYIAKEIRELKALLDEGVLSNAEFERQKSNLLK